MQPVFFIHIPKTAGTSFRLAAEACFPSDGIVYDYNQRSAETSQLVRHFLYESAFEDFWGFYRALHDNPPYLVGGHVRAVRFIDGLGAHQSVTFLREPLQRMISEYHHFCRHQGYEDTLRAFFSNPKMHNRMSKAMRDVPLEALGVVGLTERYAESLELVNQRYDWALQMREDNLAQEHPGALHPVDSEDEALFYKQNSQDVALYELGRDLLESRLAMSGAGQDYVHARLEVAQPNRIAGWAWWAGERDDPVRVEICVNDQTLTTIDAIQLRPNLLRLAPPRGGYVGFSASVDAVVGDHVFCRVVETGQKFPPRPIVITEPKHSR